MKTILRVDALDAQSSCISVELKNGSTVILELAPKQNDPLFAEIKRLSQPKTDGERIYWANGASLSLEEIMQMLESNPSAEDDL